jgi:hypothetical protein
MRWAWVCLVLVGCTREVFDHTAEAALDAGSDAGADAGMAAVDCETAEPGTRCDDDNVCTPSSTCRERQCLAGTTSRECLVISNGDRTEEEQGGNGWYYGFWNADQDEDAYYDPDTDFQPMEYCGDGNWRPPGICELTRDDEGFRWTSNLSHALQHPETNPDLELPIRRWVSTVSGPARLAVSHSVGGTFGDGTRALLLVDGDELWRHDAMAGDAAGTQMTFDVQLRIGTVIDQLVHPIDGSADDTTYFELRIEGR